MQLLCFRKIKMPSLRVTKFGGLIPKITYANKPDFIADICVDVNLSRGAIAPFRDDVKVSSKNGKIFYTDGCCFELSQDDCATFARAFADCDYLIKADDKGIWVRKHSNCNDEFFKLGFDIDLPKPSVQVLGTPANDFNRELRQYYYTIINDNDWESEPSEPSDPAVCDNDLNCVITGFISKLPENICASKIKIYCAVSPLDYGDGDSKNQLDESQFLEIGEINIGTSTFVHKAHTRYGDACKSEEYAPPPKGIHSIAYTHGGQLVGLAGDELVFSYPFLPFAFPEKYRYGNFKGTPKRFIISGKVGYILTDGLPLVIDIDSTPSEYGCRGINIIESHLPIISYRSAVAYHGGCVYASRAGLVLLSGNQAKVITLEFMTEEQWQNTQPETLRGAVVNGWYIGSTDKWSFYFKLPDNIFDNPEYYRLTELSIKADSFFTTDSGTLYFINNDGVYRWNAAERFKKYHWRSKVGVLPQYVSWTAYRIVSDAPVKLTHTAIKQHQATTSIQIELANKVVDSSRVHRLKAGFSQMYYQVEFVGDAFISEYNLATSVSELGER